MDEQRSSAVWGQPAAHRPHADSFRTVYSDLSSDLDDSQRTEPPDSLTAFVRAPPGASTDTSDDIPDVVADRYERREPLGRGGMGTVWACFDRELQRTVAVKVLRAARSTPEGRARFEEEARLSARLQHPGIVPVHDVGLLDDHRPWFAMRQVEGRTLEHVLAEVHAETAPADLTSLRRLLGVLLRICEATAYAHARGIVHRDLKPSNVMLGAFGEVLVLDWGLAIAAVREGAADGRTLIAGTPAYMAPEQARGESDRVGAAADVHALGAILYDLLTGAPPRTSDASWELVRQVARAEPVPPPSERSPWGHGVDERLDQICLRALQADPADRHADAAQLAVDVSRWLDGVQKRQRALQLVQQADAARREASDAEGRAQGLAARAEELLAELPVAAPAADKHSAWTLQDEASQQRGQARTARTRFVQLLRSALTHDPDLAAAHDRLADHFAERHGLLEHQGRDEQAHAALADLIQHDRSQRYGTYVSGTAAISLVTDPPGAEVRLHRYVEEARRLVPRFERSLGTTPLRSVPVPMGSYLLTLHREGHDDVRYPVLLRRQEHWSGVPPDASEPMAVWLPPSGVLGADDCYVPAGWFWAGDDDLQTTPPLQRRWMHPLVARRFVVTTEEYTAFLDDLSHQGREAEAVAHQPTMGDGGGVPYLERDEGGRWRGLRTDLDGPIWAALRGVTHLPVVYVALASAEAYVRWHAQQTGQPWGLPTELEWQRAARGADARSYPWGDHFEASWLRSAQPGSPMHIMSVRSYPTDVSPFGLQGMAGNVLELVHGEDGSLLRVGGSCTSGPLACRVTYRTNQPPQARIGRVGFRLVRRVG